ncbi:MAG TPA: hypothetical protein DCM38_09725 [Gammaproteobacteria bacterium]|nr:hypothetical protein [Gammaproteobacteria bacterium]
MSVIGHLIDTKISADHGLNKSLLLSNVLQNPLLKEITQHSGPFYFFYSYYKYNRDYHEVK